MLDLNFASFLTLAVISVITALIVHYALRYRFLEGIDGFFAEWIVGWIGAWLASPVLGHWFRGVEIGSIYVIPAFLGGFIGSFLPVAMWKASAKTHGSRMFEVGGTQKAA
jgi:uncharacterized membrane protein YeaQ/YmgE (transglycosylase-associated protein family)